MERRIQTRRNRKVESELLTSLPREALTTFWRRQSPLCAHLTIFPLRNFSGRRVVVRVATRLDLNYSQSRDLAAWKPADLHFHRFFIHFVGKWPQQRLTPPTMSKIHLEDVVVNWITHCTFCDFYPKRFVDGFRRSRPVHFEWPLPARVKEVREKIHCSRIFSSKEFIFGQSKEDMFIYSTTIFQIFW